MIVDEFSGSYKRFFDHPYCYLSNVGKSLANFTFSSSNEDVTAYWIPLESMNLLINFSLYQCHSQSSTVLAFAVVTIFLLLVSRSQFG